MGGIAACCRINLNQCDDDKNPSLAIQLNVDEKSKPSYLETTKSEIVNLNSSIGVGEEYYTSLGKAVRNIK